MSHHWIAGDAEPGDNCDTCWVCGISVDYPDGLFQEAMWLVPPCEAYEEGASAHHFIIVPHVGNELLDGLPDQWQLECHYGDCAGDEINLGPAPYNPNCTGDDPYSRYGTPEHEAWLIEMERQEG